MLAMDTSKSLLLGTTICGAATTAAGLNTRADNLPVDIGTEVFAANDAIGESLDRRAVLGGDLAVRQLPLADSALGDA